MQPGPAPYYQPQPLPKPKRTNCLKPIIGCVFGPVLAIALVVGCLIAILSALSVQGPEPPLGSDFEPDPTAAAQYESNIVNSLAQSVTNGDGTFSVQMDDQALSSWITEEYDTLFEEYDIPEPFLWQYDEPNFQIRFNDGQILFYVENEVPFVTLSGMLTAEVSVPTTDLTVYILDIDIIKFEAMGLDFEDDSTTISAWLTELITDQIEQYRQEAGLGDIEVTNVRSEDGILTIQGRVVN